MNHKGFTLVEAIIVVVLLSLVFVFVLRNFDFTMTLGRDEAYKIMKNNVLTSGYHYVDECIAGTLICDFSDSDYYKFSASVLKKYGYFSNLDSPVDGKDLGECLVIVGEKKNGVVILDLIDSCY